MMMMMMMSTTACDSILPVPGVGLPGERFPQTFQSKVEVHLCKQPIEAARGAIHSREDGGFFKEVAVFFII